MRRRARVAARLAQICVTAQFGVTQSVPCLIMSATENRVGTAGFGRCVPAFQQGPCRTQTEARARWRSSPGSVSGSAWVCGRFLRRRSMQGRAIES